MQSCWRGGGRKWNTLLGPVRLQRSLHRSSQTDGAISIGRDNEKESKHRKEVAHVYDNSDWTIKARHALRAILRECSYLPDEHARTYLSQYALSRFRVYSFKAWKRRDDPTFAERLKSKHEEARKALGQLRRANEGEPKPLLKVLLMTYGRTGRRRRELLIPLLPRAAQRDATQEAELEDEEMPGGNGQEIGKNEIMQSGLADVLVKQPAGGRTNTETVGVSSDDTGTASSQLSPVLYALAVSQTRANVPEISRPNPKRLRPEIPTFDARMRPLSAKRARNITIKWFADFIDRILPPLKVEEWHRLYRLALGKGISDHPSPPRRSRSAGRTSLETESAALEAVIARPNASLKKRMIHNTDAHAITRRYMQRLYAKVFSQCPLLEWDDQGRKWEVTWGVSALHDRLNAPLPPATPTGEDATSWGSSALPDVDHAEHSTSPHSSPARAAPS